MKAAPNRRISKEQYFTADDVAKQVVALFRDREPQVWRHTQIIIEPSVGGGAFLRALPGTGTKRILAFDISPQIKEANVYKADFLTLNPSKYRIDDVPPSRVLCIGNPPFGFRATTARDFINKCATFSDHILMILPLGFVSKPHSFTTVNPLFHIKWMKKLPHDIWIGPDGVAIEKDIKTAAVYIARSSRPRKIPVVFGVDEANKVSSRYRFLHSDELLKETDVVFFRFFPKVHLVGKAHTINRAANMIVRLQTRPSAALLEKLGAELRILHKEKQKTATTTLVAFVFRDVVRLLSKFYDKQ